MSKIKLLLIAGATALSALLGLGVAAQAQVVQGEEHCVVNIPATDALNVRSRPGASSRVVTTLPYGSCGVMVMAACQGSWCPIEDGHYSGWVNRRYISMVSPAIYCVSGVARNDVLNLRAYPSPSSRILTGLSPRECDIAFLPYAVGSWQKVRAAGWEGWASRRYLSGQ
ncbi:MULTISPECIES: SH3 domain-containing protein [unclassified Devosia]|uniref:SH3 domain-containing protein n=1 Tax=unclassified Devosia TaxID=196773 RepID=UPI0015576E89|nr:MULTISPECIES: SH3 domain-containing protein [unclassified Devosia]